MNLSFLTSLLSPVKHLLSRTFSIIKDLLPRFSQEKDVLPTDHMMTHDTNTQTSDEKAQQYRASIDDSTQRTQELFHRSLHHLTSSAQTIRALIEEKQYLPSSLLLSYLWSWFWIERPDDLVENQSIANHALTTLLDRFPISMHETIIEAIEKSAPLIMAKGFHQINKKLLKDAIENECDKTSIGAVSLYYSSDFYSSKFCHVFLGLTYQQDILTTADILTFFYYLYVLPHPNLSIDSQTQLITTEKLLPFFTHLNLFTIEMHKLVPALIKLGHRALGDKTVKAINTLFTYLQPFIHFDKPYPTPLLILNYLSFLQDAHSYLTLDHQGIAEGQLSYITAFIKSLDNLAFCLTPNEQQEYHDLLQHLSPEIKHDLSAIAEETNKQQDITHTNEGTSSTSVATVSYEEKVQAFLAELEEPPPPPKREKSKLASSKKLRNESRVPQQITTLQHQKNERLSQYRKQLSIVYADPIYQLLFKNSIKILRQINHDNTCIRSYILSLTHELIEHHDEPHVALKEKLKSLLFTLIDEKNCDGISDECLYFTIFSNLLYIDRSDILARNNKHHLLPLPSQETPVKKKRNQRSRREQASFNPDSAGQSKPASSDTTIQSTTIEALGEMYQDEITIKPSHKTHAFGYYRVVAYQAPIFDPSTLSHMRGIYHHPNLSIRYIQIQQNQVLICPNPIIPPENLKGIATLVGYFDYNGTFLATHIETINLRAEGNERFKIAPYPLNFPYPIYQIPCVLFHFVVADTPVYYSPLAVQEAVNLQTQSTALQYCSIAFHVFLRLSQTDLHLPTTPYLDLIYHVANIQLNSKTQLAQTLDPVYLSVVLCCMDEKLAMTAICDFMETKLDEQPYQYFLREFNQRTEALVLSQTRRVSQASASSSQVNRLTLFQERQSTLSRLPSPAQ